MSRLQVFPMGEGISPQVVVGGYHDCSRHEGGFHLYDDFKGDFEAGDWYKIKTPMDQIFEQQELPEFVQRVAWGLGVGRMLTKKDSVIEHPTHADVKLQTGNRVDCMTFFCGRAGTGESLPVHVCRKLCLSP